MKIINILDIIEKEIEDLEKAKPIGTFMDGTRNGGIKAYRHIYHLLCQVKTGIECKDCEREK